MLLMMFQVGEVNMINNTECSCDKWVKGKRRCGRKVYCEVYPTNSDKWSYLCYWHYTLDRVRCILHRKRNCGYFILGDVENE